MRYELRSAQSEMRATILLMMCCFLCGLCAGDESKKLNDTSSSLIGMIFRCNCFLIKSICFPYIDSIKL